MQERENQVGEVGEVDIDVYVRCDSDPYGLDKLFLNLKIGRETVHREQYYAVGVEQIDALSILLDQEFDRRRLP